MKSGHELTGLMKFLRRDEWSEAFEDVLDAHFGTALDAFDLEYEDITDLLDDQWGATLWGCAFEDFLTRSVAPDGRNIVDVYLKKRGFKESAQAKAYMKALRTSVMSLFEVSDITPGQSFLARDLIGGGEPILIHEATATQTLKPWQKIAARIVPMGERTIIGGGLLPFSHEAASALLGALAAANDASEDRQSSRTFPAPETEIIRKAAPLFTTAWLLDVLPKAFGEIPATTNRDGEELVFHQFHYPLAKGVRLNDIVMRLGAIDMLTQDGAKFWNWLDEGPGNESSTDDPAADAVLDLTTQDGRTVLGHVELKGRSLILTTGSVSRAARGTAMLEDALGDRLQAPRVRIETLDDFEEASQDPTTQTPDIPPEIATSLVHGFLDRQYRQTLDEPVPMLDGLSPRAAVNSADGQKKVADWIKYLENQSATEPDDPMATYDFGWIWKELGIENLRR